MAYVVSWTEVTGDDGYSSEDIFCVYEDKANADSLAQRLMQNDKVKYWVVSKPIQASEPHWMEG